MRIASFEHEGRRRHGLLDGDRFLDAASRIGESNADLRATIAASALDNCTGKNLSSHGFLRSRAADCDTVTITTTLGFDSRGERE